MNEQQVGKASRIAALIVGNMQDKLNTDEQRELHTWVQENGDNLLLYEELMDNDKLGEALDELQTVDPDEAFDRLSQKLFIATEPPAPTKRPVLKIWWYMAAATILLAVGSLVYLNINKTPAPPAIQVLAQQKQAGAALDDKKALLTLTNGTVIDLNTVNNGAIAREGNMEITKLSNGVIQYKQLNNEATPANGYNELRTPAGSRYQVILSDGSIVWLNAASNLRFAVNTNEAATRQVALTGEGYFEVAPATSPTTGGKKPFIVSADNLQIQAVGTAFNISAYQEDHVTQTTVVEGLVKIDGHNQQHLLEPGKKLVARDSSLVVEKADVAQEIAWKKDEFVFHNTSLQMVMNELARWYNMKVEYKQPVPSLHFSGEIERQASIQKVLDMLSYTGGVKFKVKGETVTVYSN